MTHLADQKNIDAIEATCKKLVSTIKAAGMSIKKTSDWVGGGSFLIGHKLEYEELVRVEVKLGGESWHSKRWPQINLDGYQKTKVFRYGSKNGIAFDKIPQAVRDILKARKEKAEHDKIANAERDRRDKIAEAAKKGLDWRVSIYNSHGVYEVRVSCCNEDELDGVVAALKSAGLLSFKE